MEISFVRPVWLLLFLFLPVLVLSHFFVFRNLKKRAFRFANFDAISRVTGQGFILKGKGTFIGKSIFLLIIRLVALSLLIFTIAGVSLSYKTSVVEGAYVIALDASSSMLADDYQPNRITAAKDAISIFLKDYKSDINAGLISFAGVSYIEHPLTTEKGELLDKISDISVKRSGGTDLAQALMTSVNMLEGAEGTKIVILITDGRSTVGSPIEIAIQYANTKSVTVNTVGMATKTGGSFLNIESLSTLDEPTLQTMANQTGGSYFHIETPGELTQKLTSVLKVSQGKHVLDLSWYFLLTVVIVLLVEWILSNTRYRSIP